MDSPLRQFALGTVLCGIVAGQSEGLPSFEVASVRPANPNRAGGSVRELLPDGINHQDQALARLVWLAYDVAPYQVTLGPGVSLYGRYDVVAKAAGPVSVTQTKLMLRSLLKERFNFIAHMESKSLPVFVLTLANGGPRFKRSADAGPMGSSVKDGSIHYTRAPISYLTGSLLSNFPSIGRPVVDRTGLAEIYDFSLRLYDPEADVTPKGDLLQQMDNGWRSSLKDLGLKLEPTREQVDILVVDHVEQPSEN